MERSCATPLDRKVLNTNMFNFPIRLLMWSFQDCRRSLSGSAIVRTRRVLCISVRSTRSLATSSPLQVGAEKQHIIAVLLHSSSYKLKSVNRWRAPYKVVVVSSASKGWDAGCVGFKSIKDGKGSNGYHLYFIFILVMFPFFVVSIDWSLRSEGVLVLCFRPFKR